MDIELNNARDTLISLWPVVKTIHPEYASVGTPAWMNNGTRLCFSIKLLSGHRRSTQYARLLLECQLGRALNADETVDHIDGNPRNNDVCNLQVLSRSDNAKKGPSSEIKKSIALDTANRMRGVPAPHVSGENNGRARLADSQVVEIRERQKQSYRGQDKVLALEFGVSRELINQIRRGVIRVKPR